MWRREVKRGLEKGLRPDGMQLSTRGILHEAGEHNVVEVLAEQLRTTLALDAGISISDT